MNARVASPTISPCRLRRHELIVGRDIPPGYASLAAITFRNVTTTRALSIMESSQRTESWEAWKKPYRYGTLALYPPQPIRDYLNNFRTELDPVSAGFSEAHISLTQPFSVAVTREVTEAVETVLREEGAFDVSFGPVRCFLPSPVIYLEVQPHQHIMELRRKLHGLGMFDLSLPHTDDFVPHLTLTEGFSGATVDDDLFRTLQQQVTGGSFTCDSISHLVPNKDFRFEANQAFALNEA